MNATPRLVEKIKYIELNNIILTADNGIIVDDVGMLFFK